MYISLIYILVLLALYIYVLLLYLHYCYILIKAFYSKRVGALMTCLMACLLPYIYNILPFNFAEDKSLIYIQYYIPFILGDWCFYCLIPLFYLYSMRRQKFYIPYIYTLYITYYISIYFCLSRQGNNKLLPQIQLVLIVYIILRVLYRVVYKNSIQANFERLKGIVILVYRVVYIAQYIGQYITQLLYMFYMHRGGYALNWKEMKAFLGWVHNFFKSSNPLLNIYFLYLIKAFCMYIYFLYYIKGYIVFYWLFVLRPNFYFYRLKKGFYSIYFQAIKKTT